LLIILDSVFADLASDAPPHTGPDHWCKKQKWKEPPQVLMADKLFPPDKKETSFSSYLSLTSTPVSVPVIVHICYAILAKKRWYVKR
jgi:hypothetical protein